MPIKNNKKKIKDQKVENIFKSSENDEGIKASDGQIGVVTNLKNFTKPKVIMINKFVDFGAKDINNNIDKEITEKDDKINNIKGHSKKTKRPFLNSFVNIGDTNFQSLLIPKRNLSKPYKSFVNIGTANSFEGNENTVNNFINVENIKSDETLVEKNQVSANQIHGNNPIKLAPIVGTEPVEPIYNPEPFFIDGQEVFDVEQNIITAEKENFAHIETFEGQSLLPFDLIDINNVQGTIENEDIEFESGVKPAFETPVEKNQVSVNWINENELIKLTPIVGIEPVKPIHDPVSFYIDGQKEFEHNLIEIEYENLAQFEPFVGQNIMPFDLIDSKNVKDPFENDDIEFVSQYIYEPNDFFELGEDTSSEYTSDENVGFLEEDHISFVPGHENLSLIDPFVPGISKNIQTNKENEEKILEPTKLFDQNDSTSVEFIDDEKLDLSEENYVPEDFIQFMNKFGTKLRDELFREFGNEENFKELVDPEKMFDVVKKIKENLSDGDIDQNFYDQNLENESGYSKESYPVSDISAHIYPTKLLDNADYSRPPKITHVKDYNIPPANDFLSEHEEINENIGIDLPYSVIDAPIHIEQVVNTNQNISTKPQPHSTHTPASHPDHLTKQNNG